MALNHLGFVLHPEYLKDPIRAFYCLLFLLMTILTLSRALFLLGCLLADNLEIYSSIKTWDDVLNLQKNINIC